MRCVGALLIHDHDHKYGGGSDLVFEADGMTVIRTPIAGPAGKLRHRAPNRLDQARIS